MQTVLSKLPMMESERMGVTATKLVDLIKSYTYYTGGQMSATVKLGNMMKVLESALDS